MRSRTDKRRGVRLAVETLEGCALLSATPIHVSRPETATAHLGSIREAGSKSGPVLVLLGKANGSIYAITSTTTSGVNTLILGSGLTPGLPGLVAVTAVQYTAIKGNRVQVTKGTGSFAPLAATTGSYLSVTYNGSGPIAKTGANQSFSISGTVNGGNGAYTAAKGTFSGRVVVNPLLGTMSMTYSMRVRPVAG